MGQKQDELERCYSKCDNQVMLLGIAKSLLGGFVTHGFVDIESAKAWIKDVEKTIEVEE